jgi:hypothetical protein
MKFSVIRRCLFHTAAAISLLLCLVSAAFWARSLGHFEMIHWRHNRWQHADGLEVHFASLSWYSNTFRGEWIHYPVGSIDLRGQYPQYRGQYPPGSNWDFVGDETTREMNGFRTGFFARKFPYQTGVRYEVTVRPWLPTLLAAILPVVWLIQYRRRHGVLWRFGLRELLLSVTTIAALLGCGLWLMR